MKKIVFLYLMLCSFILNAQPMLKGGLANFVLANKVYPGYSLRNCIDGTVNISFKLNQKGAVYHSEVRKGVGTDLDNEALRLIRMTSGRWIIPQGYDTTVSVLVPINFKITGEQCGNKSREEIQQAIEAYKAITETTNAILNFYKNKALGHSTKEEESKILALKNNLGYDDNYLQERINAGKKKLEQKDNQGACEDFLFVKYMGSNLADELLAKYCN